MKRILLALMGVMALVGIGISVPMLTASAGVENGQEGCNNPVIVVVDRAAFDEVIEHPAETHVVNHAAVTETQPDQRYAWLPQGPVDESQSAPGWPTTSQGTWQPNTRTYNGTDPLGTVLPVAGGGGNDNAAWFYWTTKQVVIEEAWDETVTDREAWTEAISHAAETHEVPNPNHPCETSPADPTTSPVIDPLQDDAPQDNPAQDDVLQDDAPQHEAPQDDAPQDKPANEKPQKTNPPAPAIVTTCQRSKCSTTETLPDGTTTTTVKEYPKAQQEEGF